MGQLTPKEVKKRKAQHVEAMQEMGLKILTASKIKQYFKTLGVRMDTSLLNDVAHEVYRLLYKSVQRAQANDRKTVRPADL